MLTNLPTETLAQILSRLDGRSLVTIQSTCQRIFNLVKESVELQYQIELYAAGMIDGRYDRTHTTEERLTRLRLYQQNWETFANSRVCTTNPDGRLRTRLEFNELPTLARNKEESYWTLKNIQYPILSLKMDATQDLLVILSHPRTAAGYNTNVAELHVLSLHSGEKHPRAAEERLSLADESDDERLLRLCLIRISGDLLCLLLSEKDELTIWDWTNNTLLLELKVHNIRSCAFLTDNLLLLGIAGPAIHHPHEDHDNGQIVVCDIKRTSAIQAEQPRRNALVSACELHFPDGVCVNRIRFQPSSNTNTLTSRHTPPPNTPADAHVAVPFTISTLTQIFFVALNLYLVVGSNRDGWRRVEMSLGLIVPTATFLDAINKTSSSPEVSASDKGRKIRLGSLPPRRNVVPWSQWGPDGTRALTEHGVSYSTFATHGSRFVRTTRPHGDPYTGIDYKAIEILDFNKLAVLRDIALDRSTADKSQSQTAPGSQSAEGTSSVEAAPPPPISSVQSTTITSPTSFNFGGLLEKAFETRLPYRSTIIRFDIHGCYRALIAEDNIIVGETYQTYDDDGELDHRSRHIALSLSNVTNP